MPRPGAAPSPRPSILGEILWERRGPLKAVHLWLPLVLAGPIYGWRFIDRGTVLACLQMLAAAACFAQASILVNDLAEERADRAAGKSRWVHALRPRAGAIAAGGIAGAGGLALLPGAPSAWPVAAYAGAVALGGLYSLPPFRLKERGALGLLGYGFSAALAYAVVPWAWLRPGGVVLAVAAAAVLLDKWVHLHLHQMRDLQADRECGFRTYAVRVGPGRAGRSLRRMAVLACIPMVALWIFAASLKETVGPGAALLTAGAALIAGRHAVGLRRRGGTAASAARRLPWTYLGASFATFRVLPLPFLARGLWTPHALLLLGLMALMVILESWSSVRQAPRQQPP